MTTVQIPLRSESVGRDLDPTCSYFAVYSPYFFYFDYKRFESFKSISMICFIHGSQDNGTALFCESFSESLIEW